jgi:hypothetical protein
MDRLLITTATLVLFTTTSARAQIDYQAKIHAMDQKVIETTKNLNKVTALMNEDNNDVSFIEASYMLEFGLNACVKAGAGAKTRATYDSMAANEQNVDACNEVLKKFLIKHGKTPASP